MSMGIGTNTQKPDEGELKRKMKEIACSVWYTSKGRTIPMMFKYQDEEGVIQKFLLINRIKSYMIESGTRIHECTTENGGK